MKLELGWLGVRPPDNKSPDSGAVRSPATLSLDGVVAGTGGDGYGDTLGQDGVFRSVPAGGFYFYFQFYFFVLV